jgi:hypothetical protein
VYYKGVKFHKNPISGLGGVALTRYMDGRGDSYIPPNFVCWGYAGADPGFQVRGGAHLKKLRRTEGGACFRKVHFFYIISFQVLQMHIHL